MHLPLPSIALLNLGLLWAQLECLLNFAGGFSKSRTFILVVRKWKLQCKTLIQFTGKDETGAEHKLQARRFKWGLKAEWFCCEGLKAEWFFVRFVSPMKTSQRLKPSCLGHWVAYFENEILLYYKYFLLKVVRKRPDPAIVMHWTLKAQISFQRLFYIILAQSWIIRTETKHTCKKQIRGFRGRGFNLGLETQPWGKSRWGEALRTFNPHSPVLCLSRRALLIDTSGLHSVAGSRSSFEVCWVHCAISCFIQQYP